MAAVYLALGSNLGDRLQFLRGAVAGLAPFVRVTAKSSIYETEPWGVVEQPRFLNMAVAGETALEPAALLGALKSLERALGRPPPSAGTVRYGPRVLDLDILLYDNRVVQEEDLEIPHPRLAERSFVLVPLAEIAPGVVHPRLRRTVREMLDVLPDTKDVQWFAPPP